MAFDSSKSALTKNNFAVGFSNGDFTLHTNVNDGQVSINLKNFKLKEWALSNFAFQQKPKTNLIREFFTKYYLFQNPN